MIDVFLFAAVVITLELLYNKYIKKDNPKTRNDKYKDDDDYEYDEDNDDDDSDYHDDSEDYEDEEEENHEDTNYKKEYKQYIGEKFEQKGDFVIYNYFLENAYKGFDMITLSCSSKYINFIKCKYWKNKSITESRIEKVYQKLNDYVLYRQSTDGKELGDLLGMKLYECGVKSTTEISKLFSIRKILYIAKGKTINLEENKNIIKIKDNIFRYKDMKIVFTKNWSDHTYN